MVTFKDVKIAKHAAKEKYDKYLRSQLPSDKHSAKKAGQHFRQLLVKCSNERGISQREVLKEAHKA